ncbi:MAG: hypothetical protein WCT06_00875 [Armatimonadota bacterium]|jgi:hypothetical protein
MDIGDFKNLVKEAFGKNLDHATPENVKEFLDNMTACGLESAIDGRAVLDEDASLYEEIVKDFFSKVLDMPKEDALIVLWLLAFDLVFSAIEAQQADRFKSIFGDFK